MKHFLVLAVILFSLQTTMATVSHHHHHQEKKALTLNHDKKWEVDAVMRKNMNAIHNKFKLVQNLMRTNKVTEKDYTSLGEVISLSAQDIASNCKMAPKADETFHVILNELFAISDDLNKKDKASTAIKKLHHSLSTYSQYFSHTFND